MPQVIAFETRTGVSVGAGLAAPPQVAAAGESGAVPQIAPDGLALGADVPHAAATRASADRSRIRRRGLIRRQGIAVGPNLPPG